MRTRTGTSHRQRGAIAVITAIVIVLLVGMLGLVIDLGVLYVRKTELQNAADAAALAGARELNGTRDGVEEAGTQAKALALLNGMDFAAVPVKLELTDLAFGPGPAGPWTSYADSLGAPQNKWFIRVVTPEESRPTWFIQVLDETLTQTAASALAVAGRTLCEGIPIFTCVPAGALDGNNRCVDANCGFIPGKSYRLTAKEGANITIGPGNIGWLDPVAPGERAMISGTNDLRDLLCRGKAMCLDAPATFTSLTQNAFNPTADALNTRFGIFQGPLNKAEYKDGANACLVDTNIKEYRFNDAGPATWQSPAPSAQTNEEAGAGGVGVWWSVVRPSAGSVPAIVSGAYPGTGTPYSQTTGDNYYEPYNGPVATQAGRRILSIGLAGNCGSITGSGKPVEIVAYARFLMQRLAFDSGSEKGFHGEFIEVVPSGPVLRPGIKLYR